MTKYVKVSSPDIADDLFLKRQEVNIRGKKFQTPIKTIDASKLHPDIKVSDDIKGLNEIFKTFNEERLREYLTGKKDESLINLELNRKIEKTNPRKEATICFISYDGMKYPDEKGIDFLMNTAYEFSDATPLPLIPKLRKMFENDKRNFNAKLEDYKNFMKKCIDSINRFNTKPILGVIPEVILSAYVVDLVEFYYENNITSFVYDFKGKVSTGMKTKLREMMIALKDIKLLEKSFLYSINANNGKMIKDAPIVRARDILTFGFGFNALGDQHIRRAFPPDIAKRIGERMKKNPMHRLFNNKDYGYYKTSNLSILENIYPKNETSIPFENFKIYNDKARRSQVLFNNERLGKETIKYQKIVKEESNKTTDYFKTKEYIREKDIKDLTNFRDQIRV